MSITYLWQELTRQQIGRVASDALFVLPLGSTEQHGPHLATGTDAAVATAIARGASEAADHPEVILLAPTLVFGASDHHLEFGATLSLSLRTLQLVVDDILRSVSKAGCRRAFLLNAHGGNTPVCHGAVSEAARRYGLVAATANVADFVDASEIGGPVRGHAGSFETSLMLAIHPAGVHLEDARPSPGGPARHRGSALVVGDPDRWRQLDGFTDDPTGASVEAGEASFSLCVQRVAEAYGEIAKIGCGAST